MPLGTIRSHGIEADSTFFFGALSRRFLSTARTSCRADCLCFFFFIRANPAISASRFQALQKQGTSGQNAAAPAKDRRAFAGCRGQMTHAGLAVMAVAARLGPA